MKHQGRDVIVTCAARVSDLKHESRAGLCVCSVFLGPLQPSNAELRQLATTLIRGGATVLRFHGKDCERAHDIADLVRDQLETEIGRLVLTTWHDDESEDDFIDTAFVGAFPPEPDFDAWTHHLFVIIGSEADCLRLRQKIVRWIAG